MSKADFIPEPISLYAERFISYLASEKHYSAHTLTAYSNDLSQFFDFIYNTYSITEITDLNHQVVRSWLAHLIQHNLTARAVNRKLSTLKSFFRFLIQNDMIRKNPMQKVIAPKTSRKLPAFIEATKINQLLDSDVFNDDFSGIRDWLAIEMLYASGMRVSELVSLKCRDLDLKSMTFRVTGKRNKQRLIPFMPVLLKLINQYLEVRERLHGKIQPDDFFIITNKGKAVYPRLLYNIVHYNLQFVTTQIKKSPHVLRHSFATGMLNNGADLNAIKELLGHANLAATQVYTHNTIDRIKRIYHQTHPKA